MTPDWELLAAAGAVLFVASFTPGPNNAICCALAAGGGLRRALPFAAGVIVGFPLLMLFAGLGLGALLSAFPNAHLWIKICGALFLLRLAWKIASAETAGENEDGEASAKARKRSWGLFVEAVLFQWINPKGIAVTASMIAAYTRPGENLYVDVLGLSALAFMSAVISMSTWGLAGTAIRRYLKSPSSRRVFNITMAVLLSLAIPPIFFV